MRTLINALCWITHRLPGGIRCILNETHRMSLYTYIAAAHALGYDLTLTTRRHP